MAKREIPMVPPRKRGRPYKSTGNPLGRPKKPAYDLEAERAKVKEQIQKNRERIYGTDDVVVPDLCSEVEALSHRNRLTKEELDDLKGKVKTIYNHYVEEKHRKEEELYAPYREVVKALAFEKKEQEDKPKMMTREEYYEAVGLRFDGSKKRGRQPAPKKNIFDLEPGDKGTTTEPTVTDDVERFETAYLEEKVEERRKEKQKRKHRKPLVGVV